MYLISGFQTLLTEEYASIGKIELKSNLVIPITQHLNRYRGTVYCGFDMNLPRVKP